MQVIRFVQYFVHPQCKDFSHTLYKPATGSGHHLLFGKGAVFKNRLLEPPMAIWDFLDNLK